MQSLQPSWKIPSRPCPFYPKGKCFFSENCNFLHEIQTTSNVVHVSRPDDEDYNASDSCTTVAAEPPLQSLYDYIHSPHDSDFDSDEQDSPDDGGSDPDSPTIRNPALSRPADNTESVTTKTTGPSRDSVTTVKADSHSSDAESSVARTHSLPKLDVKPRHRSSSNSSQNSRQDSAKQLKLLPPFPESLTASAITTPTSATAQELEVPNFADALPLASHFALANAASSSLLASRLAKRTPLSLPPAALEPTDEVLTSPFSATALYASYQEYEPVPVLPSTDANSEATSRDPVSPIPHVVSRTPTWLRPLRLASVLTPQTDSQSSTSSNSDSRNFTHGTNTSQSQSSLATHSSGSPNPLSDSPIFLDSPGEISRRSSYISNDIPTNTPHTIVLSDYDDYVSPFAISSYGSVSFDTSGLPPNPASPETVSAHRSSSSQTSISLSELTGGSPRKRRVAPSKEIEPSPLGSSDINAIPPRDKATTPAQQFKSALERRAKRMRESSRLILSSELQSGIPDSNCTLDLQHPRSDSALEASPPEFAESQSWSTLPHISQLTHSNTIPTTALSDSLLMQPTQSSPPRTLRDLRPSQSVPIRSSPLLHASGTQDNHTASPEPSSRPQLLFAIASDQPAEVERLLSSGEASVNETTGTGTGLLEFTVANEGLKNKTQIVKTLLKYGADPRPLNDIMTGEDVASGSADVHQSPALVKKIEEAMDPAMKYYLTRPHSLDVDSKPALEVLQQSSFAPLARARFDIIGQDRALDEFYRVLGMHSQRKGRNALVVLLCGASGHGKSLLAQKVGSSLNVPIHTINMTALRSQHDLWQCLSTGVNDVSPDLDLSEFLVENQGKPCVVVLDEIEKVDDAKSLNPLLLPWDIGRCSLEQKKHTDTSKVIWIATSNLGQELVAEHVAEWGHPDIPPTRAEYTQLATAVRRRIAEVLGASLLSRVTAILPFLPFSEVEKIAIGTEAALSHGGFLSTPMSSAEIEALVKRAVKDANLVEEEGARSLYRVVETHLSMRT